MYSRGLHNSYSSLETSFVKSLQVVCTPEDCERMTRVMMLRTAAPKTTQVWTDWSWQYDPPTQHEDQAQLQNVTRNKNIRIGHYLSYTYLHLSYLHLSYIHLNLILSSFILCSLTCMFTYMYVHLSYPIFTYLMLSSHILCSLIFSYLILSSLILICSPILSYLHLSYPIFTNIVRSFVERAIRLILDQVSSHLSVSIAIGSLTCKFCSCQDKVVHLISVQYLIKDIFYSNISKLTISYTSAPCFQTNEY